MTTTTCATGTSGRPTTVPAPAGLARPRTGRRVERVLLVVAGAYGVLMASLTLFLYSGALRDTGLAALEAAGEVESGAGDLQQVAAVVDVYAGLVLAVATVTLLIAAVGLRRERPLSADGRRGARRITIWLIVCIVFSLVTTDFIGMLLYSVTLAVHCARHRALRKLA
jgi:hypothetical protein